MSVAGRLIIVLILPIAVCFGAFSVGIVHFRRTLMLTEAEQEIRDHGTALAPAFNAFLADHDLRDLSALTEDLARADRILGVLVFDELGHPVNATSIVGSYQDALAPLARRVWLSGNAQVELDTLGGVPTYSYAFAVGRASGGLRSRGVTVVLRDLGYIARNLAGFQHEIALLGAGTIAVVAISIWLAMRTMLARPLAELVSGFERVAKEDLTVEIPVHRADEIGRLSVAFNHMTGSLRRAREELAAKGEANLALEKRLHHAQRLALVGQLTANIAHQIGSPLNVILGRARYALKAGGQNERDERHLREIVAGAESVSRVIEQFLGQARRVRGPLVPIDVGQLARATLDFLAAECERWGIVASLDADPGAFVEGRRDELEQIILNLCLNAIQVQPRGGRLLLTVRSVDKNGRSNVEIDVADRGPGVPVALRSRIFEAFFTTKPPDQGTGLGLAICEELVSRQGGTIIVSDRDARDGGACFRVTLPRYPTTTALAPVEGAAS